MSTFAGPAMGKETEPNDFPITVGQSSQSNSFAEDREGGEDAILEAKVERVYK